MTNTIGISYLHRYQMKFLILYGTTISAEPDYVDVPVIVIGRDIYVLDRDNDGVGCERG